MNVRPQLRWLFVSVALMVIGLGTSLAFLARAARVLSLSDEAIVGNTAPSIIALDEAQERLRELHLHVLSARGTSQQDRAVADARRALDDKLGDYLRLPTDPGELPLQRAIRESAAQVQAAVDIALATPPGMAGEGVALRDLEQALDRLSLDLVRAGAFNAEIARAAASEVASVSRSALPLAAVIEGLTVAATAGTLALTYRSVRRAEALWTESRAALDRRAEELELFAARVAHDLLSPLMTVSLALDFASRKLKSPEDTGAQNAVSRAKRTLTRVRRFVSDLLEFARAGATPAPGAHASVEDVVHEIVDEFAPLAREAGVELRVEPELVVATPEVACSSGVLISALSNLVQNAIKYIGESERRRVSIRTTAEDGAVRFEVEDTGPGIAAADRERLFELYVRGRDSKTPGLGLGLATVKRLVESHGGRVGVRAANERGTVFWISLPTAESERAPQRLKPLPPHL